ncbi:cobaltochelatase subunit CobN [uncultured Jatrophihabitans sp.]|uniref:cobaltochelatase subunit CobN n=1 Tax=uncultured Jatrophihabitans sp. TaxID=1610747 RepID=UPI0035C9D7BD
MILLLSTSDTDLLAAQAADGPVAYRCANPTRVEPGDVSALLDGVELAVVRLLGGEATWPVGLAAVAASGVPTVVLGGEAAPDADLMARSTVSTGVASTALGYLVEGGPANLAALAAFLSDTVLRTGHGFDQPVSTPAVGVRGGAAPPDPDGRPRVGVVYYRAHELAGNTAFVDDLATALEVAGAQPVPVFCASLRGLASAGSWDAPLLRLLRGCDALVITVLAAGGVTPADASAGGAEDAWSIGALADLDIPLLQGICLTSSRAAWAAADSMSPMDAAMQVAIPEFDGRIIGVPFSFKEAGDDGIPRYVADPERTRRLAGLAHAHARLRHVPAAQRRIGILLSSYPTKHARVGNAVGLDTPASAVRLLAALADSGVDVGGPPPQDGTALIHQLIAAGGHDVEWLTEAQLAAAPARLPAEAYARLFGELPAELQAAMREHWGEPPGSLYVDGGVGGGDIVLAGLLLGNVALMIQPPRGFGENPIAIYHDPLLPPSHHYLAAYRWLADDFGADAIVHLGKHGTLEWLPGKGLGASAGCAPDAVLGNLPLVYPFIVNDPGEGTQAKRRAHAVVVDHLIPPMARADTYGEMAKLEQLLDEYASVAALDPDKLATVRDQIWEVVQEAQLHHDMHADAMPDADEFDDFVLHLDGYLCEIKDVQIRDGLHILGDAPMGEARVNLVLAILRAQQVFGGAAPVDGLRATLARGFGLDEAALLAEPGAPAPPSGRLPALVDGPAASAADLVDLLETLARRLVQGMEDEGWTLDAASGVLERTLETQAPDVAAVLDFAVREIVPRLAATTDELDRTVGALEGRFVPPGPSGSPTRGLVSVLPTGRNFYSVDPKAIPSRNAYAVGVALADSLLARHLADHGTYPASVGLTVWGTSAMRTQGDDIAEVLALLGCRPVWDDASRRVTGFEVIPPAELGRPRIDVTVRISGFFRDAFSHVIDLLDDAVAAVAALDEPAEQNYLRRHVEADLAEQGDWRRATLRIFGSKPGAYGAGLLPLIDARNWHDDADLAEVFAVWGGYAYGRGLAGVQARPDMERSFARIAVAAKNADTREHDIMDSDDYFQYHGGMIAMVRHLTGQSPEAYIGDSATPSAVKTRTLAEETQRVFRSRVVNPKWISAMQRHGYKGAFELAATVDYLFGYDATAGVVPDWMYEKLASAYVFDDGVREFMQQANPWALRGITERLLEAAERGMWAKPEEQTLDGLRAAYLAGEDDLEGRE